MAAEEDSGEFYLRYYVGHKGKFGHEFLEFEFRPDGKLRYANNSNYKNDTMIRKEVFLTPAVLKECRRIISESEIMKEDDNNWPEPDRVGRQELEIVMGNEHISFTTSKIGSLVDVQSSKDPEGLRIFYYLVQPTPNLWDEGSGVVVVVVVFNYDSSSHSVDEVSKSDYDNCNSGNALKSYTGGKTVITLSSTGTMYFICPTAGHCSAGMKVAVPVVAASGSTPSTPSTPSGSPPSGSTSSPPPPPSSSGAATIMSTGLVLGFSLVLGTVLANIS
ncbi:hypothetical protein PTKIN_Ptkin12aG0209600 [Pterospermum kingtungense]